MSNVLNPKIAVIEQTDGITLYSEPMLQNGTLQWRFTIPTKQLKKKTTYKRVWLSTIPLIDDEKELVYTQQEWNGLGKSQRRRQRIDAAFRIQRAYRHRHAAMLERKAREKEPSRKRKRKIKQSTKSTSSSSTSSSSSTQTSRSSKRFKPTSNTTTTVPPSEPCNDRRITNGSYTRVTGAAVIELQGAIARLKRTIRTEKRRVEYEYADTLSHGNDDYAERFKDWFDGITKNSTITVNATTYQRERNKIIQQIKYLPIRQRRNQMYRTIEIQLDNTLKNKNSVKHRIVPIDRKYNKNFKSNISTHEIQCKTIQCTVERDLVHALQHTLLKEDGYSGNLIYIVELKWNASVPLLPP